MSDRPTPETDAALHEGLLRGNPMPTQVVHFLFARKLEKERDEAREALSSIHRWIERNHADGFIDSLTYFQNLERVTDSWYDRIGAIESDARRFVRERDEAREELKHITEYGTEEINAAVDLRQKLASALVERDEAREALADWQNAAAHVEADHADEVHCSCVPILRKLLTDARRERDEALEAAAKWESSSDAMVRERNRKEESK